VCGGGWGSRVAGWPEGGSEKELFLGGGGWGVCSFFENS